MKTICVESKRARHGSLVMSALSLVKTATLAGCPDFRRDRFAEIFADDLAEWNGIGGEPWAKSAIKVAK